MDDEILLRMRVAKASRAKEILDNEVFQESFEQIKQEYITAWTNTPARDSEGREKLYLMIKTLEKVKLQLEATMEDGKIANSTLQHLLNRAKDFLWAA